MFTVEVKQQCNSFMKFGCEMGASLLKQSQNLDPSYKTDLDFCDCFGRVNICLITEEYYRKQYARAIRIYCKYSHHTSLIFLFRFLLLIIFYLFIQISFP